MLQKNDRIELKFAAQFRDQRRLSFEDEIDVVRRVEMTRAVSERTLFHLLDLLHRGTLFRKFGFEAFNDLFHAVFLAARIDGQQTFITTFHNVSILFCSVVSGNGGCNAVVRKVLEGFRRAFKCTVHRWFLRSIEFAQDMVDQLFGPRSSSDSDSQAHKSLAQMFNNRLETVVTAVAAR